jgi:hypothetical protein
MDKYKEVHEGMTFEVREFTDTEDDRRTKTYSRLFGVWVTVEHPEFPQGRCFLDLQKCLSDAFVTVSDSLVNGAKVFAETSWRTTRLSVKFEHRAEKPSKIVGPEAAWAWSGRTPETVAKKMIEVALASHAALVEELAVEDRLQKANHIRSWAMKSIRADAKATVRYEQRLAGLKAELQKEIEVLYKGSMEELRVKAEESGFDARVIKAGILAAGEGLADEESDTVFGSALKSIDKNLLR